MIFCVLDTETTGLKPDYHEVIQVAALICDGDLKEIDRLSFKIQPQYLERASQKALEITGFHPRTWRPRFYNRKKAMECLNKFLDKYAEEECKIVMGGQNTQFDYNFLKNEYERVGVVFPFSPVLLDLMDVAKVWSKVKKVKLKRYSLKYLAKFTNQVNMNPHDAEADAEVTLDILKWFIKDLKRGTKHERKCVRKHTTLKI